MHELSMTQRVLELSLQQVQQAGAQCVTDVYLVVGQLSSIADESVQFYWDVISPGTPAEGARLHFRHVPAEIMCLDCGRRDMPAGDDPACPACGSARVKVVAGEEFFLEAIGADSGAPET